MNRIPPDETNRIDLGPAAAIISIVLILMWIGTAVGQREIAKPNAASAAAGTWARWMTASPRCGVDSPA